jgi:hypothetical protein
MSEEKPGQSADKDEDDKKEEERRRFDYVIVVDKNIKKSASPFCPRTLPFSLPLSLSACSLLDLSHQPFIYSSPSHTFKHFHPVNLVERSPEVYEQCAHPPPFFLNSFLIVHSTPSLSELCLTIRQHSLFLDLSLHPFPQNRRIQLIPRVQESYSSLFFSPFLKIGQITPSLQSTGNPFPLHTPIISSTILFTILSVPYIHATFCTPTLPGAFLFFKFLICLSTSSAVISVSSGAVCFSFISVPASPSSFLPSSSFMKYSSHFCIVISSLTDSFFFPSRFMDFHTSLSVLISFISFSYHSLFCFFFSLHLSLYLLFTFRNLLLSILFLLHSLNAFTTSFVAFSTTSFSSAAIFSTSCSSNVAFSSHLLYSFTPCSFHTFIVTFFCSFLFFLFFVGSSLYINF